MKKLTILCSLLFLIVIASCKKDNAPVKPNDSKTNPPVIAAVTDSVFYTVDGKVYASGSNPYAYLSTGTQQVNQKVVYPDKSNLSNYELVGIPDSVLFYQRNIVSSENASLTILFIKKYIKRHKNDGSIYFPVLKDLLKQFTVGKYQYAEDFGRENLRDGIALSISANGKTYTSYSPFDLNKPSQLKPGFQKNSTFEIINFTRATSGGYNLEARFTAVIADGLTEEQKVLKNGYLRLYFVPVVAVDPSGQ